MFIQELDRPCYVLVDKRGFDDKELPVVSEAVASYIRAEEARSQKFQLWLREVYMAGDRSYRAEVPPWVLEGAANAEMQKQQDSAPASSKTLRLQPKQKASATNTNQ